MNELILKRYFFFCLPSPFATCSKNASKYNNEGGSGRKLDLEVFYGQK